MPSPTLNFTASSTDLLVGGTGNDTFTLNNDTDLVGTDTALGQGGHDKIVVTNAFSQLTDDNQFTGIHNIQELDYAKSVTGLQLLNLGSHFAASGITTIDASLTKGNPVQIDLSNVNVSNMVITGGQDQNTITGTSHNDLIRIRADTLTSADNMFGGGHEVSQVANVDLRLREGDVLQLFQDTGPVTINDGQLFLVQDFNTLALAGKAAFNLTLGFNAQDVNLDLIDVSAATGVVKVDASARTDHYEILFSGAGLTATDMVKGTLGLTTIGITDKAAIMDAAFTQVSGVRTIEVVNNSAVADYTGAKITLGAKSLATGVNRIVNNSGEELTVDASGRADTITFIGSDGKDTFIGTQGQNTFFGGGGDDTLSLKVAGFASSDTFNGAGGTDTLRISDSDNAVTKIVDADFTGFTSVEKLAFDAAGKQDVTLAGDADTAGLATVDGSKITGGLTLDSSGMADNIAVIAGSGADHFTLNGTSSVTFVSKNLTSADTVAGTSSFESLHFSDAVKLTDAYFAALKTNVTNLVSLEFDNLAKGQSLVAGDNFSAFMANSIITGVSVATDQGFTFDFSKYTLTGAFNEFISGGAGNDVFLLGNNGNMIFSGGEGADIFTVSSANLASAAINGGGGFRDEIDVTSAGTLADTAFSNVSNVEILKLLATKSGSYDITLDTNAQTNELTTVDASLAGVNVKVDAHTLTTESLTVTAGGKDNDLIGGSNADTFVFDAKTFNAADTVDGGSSGLLGDTLRFSTGGVIATGAFDGTDNIEQLVLSEAGNSVTLSDHLVGGSEGVVIATLPDGVTPDFVVNGGKGNDKVDLSQLTDASKHVQVSADLGKDTLIGSVGDDQFGFFKDGGLTSADVVNGGLGRDTVFAQLGTYGADTFKGLTSIEEVAFGAFAGSGAATKLTLNNDAFKGADLNSDGTKDLTIHLYDGGDSMVDASGVTSRLNHVTAIFDNTASDIFIGSANADTIGFTDVNGLNLDAADKINGAGGVDTLLLQLTDNTSALADADLAGVSHVERLEVNIDTGVSSKIELGANALAAGITEVVDASGAGAAAMDLDATAFAGDLIVSGNTNGSLLKIALGDGDDTVRITSLFGITGGDVIKGGNGVNTLDMVGGGVFGDTAFTKVEKFSDFVGEGGTYALTLDAKANAAGFSLFDLSHSQGNNTISLGGNFTNSVTIIGGDQNETFSSSKAANMTVTGGSGADALTGGTGNDTYVYTLAADSFMTDANDTAHMDTIGNFQGSNGSVGDVIDLTAFGLPSGGNTNIGTGFADLAAIVADIQGNSSHDFTGAGVSIIFGRTNTDTFLFVDANQNGVLDFGHEGDVVIKVVGTSAFSLGQDGAFAT